MCQKIKLEEKCPLTEVGGWEINLSLLASVLSLERNTLRQALQPMGPMCKRHTVLFTRLI